MAANSWWAFIAYPVLFCVPWIAGIVWVWRKVPRSDGTPPPSMGELARKRLGVP